MFKNIQILLLFFSLFNNLDMKAQSKFHFGIEVSPSIKIQSIRNKATGIFTSITGYGFNLGLPIKYKLEDNKAISTGILYEFTAFDNRINTLLISSFRLNSINIPLIYNYPITANYFVNMGGGVNYIVLSKQFENGIWSTINKTINQFQPYLCFGGALSKSKGSNTYELGINARYHLLNLISFNTLTSTNIVSVDLNLKYFF